jgi:hypothetical protein
MNLEITEFNNYLVWYETQKRDFRTFNYLTQEYKTFDKLPFNINTFLCEKHFMPKKKSIKELSYDEEFKLYDEILKEYSDKLLIWRNEILTCKTLINPFDYFEPYKFINKKGFEEIIYRNHGKNILRMFTNLTKKDKYINMEPIDMIESKWFEKCSNCGLQYLREAGVYDCYGYDYSMSYPTNYCEKGYYIPTKRGCEEILLELPNKIKFGFYNVSITSDDPKFKMLFLFNSNNVYTSYDLKYALELSKTYQANIKLIQSNTPNCYLYSNKDLVSGKEIFFNWLMRMKDLKQEFPFNGLVKGLTSSSWGRINKMNIINYTETYINNNNIDVGYENDETEYLIVDMEQIKNDFLYKLLKRNQSIYKMNIRLKPFITSYTRVKIAKTAQPVINNVIRICTDSLILDKPYNFNIPDFKPESKSTGEMEWFNINKGIKL